MINEPKSPRLIILEQLEGGCIELFSEYGISLQLSNSTVQESNCLLINNPGFIALISMTNPELRLTVALQTQKAVLEASFPSEQKVTALQQLQDWIGELSNQLAGRLKNKMRLYDCQLNLGIPTVIQGDNMYLDLPKRSEISQHSFTTSAGQILLLNLTTQIGNRVVFCEPDTYQNEEALDEGEMMFF